MAPCGSRAQINCCGCQRKQHFEISEFKSKRRCLNSRERTPTNGSRPFWCTFRNLIWVGHSFPQIFLPILAKEIHPWLSQHLGLWTCPHADWLISTPSHQRITCKAREALGASSTLDHTSPLHVPSHCSLIPCNSPGRKPTLLNRWEIVSLRTRMLDKEPCGHPLT